MRRGPGDVRHTLPDALVAYPDARVGLAAAGTEKSVTDANLGIAPFRPTRREGDCVTIWSAVATGGFIAFSFVDLRT